MNETLLERFVREGILEPGSRASIDLIVLEGRLAAATERLAKAEACVAAMKASAVPAIDNAIAMGRGAVERDLAACREQLAATDNLRRVAEHELAGAWHTTNELRAALAHTATAGDAVAVPVEALREAVEALHEVYSEISLGKWICRACGGKRDNLTTAECDHRADCLVGKALDSLRALLPGEGA
jgi:hypothetical protein